LNPTVGAEMVKLVKEQTPIYFLNFQAHLKLLADHMLEWI